MGGVLGAMPPVMEGKCPRSKELGGVEHILPLALGKPVRGRVAEAVSEPEQRLGVLVAD